jgi:ubiquinone/menaquinone biosynthesis C-methylase UbiE
MKRVLEPEVMDTAAEAADYDAMDHAEVNARFCEDLLAETAALRSPVLDVGTGTALIPIELCKRAPGIEVLGIDLAEHMLSLARHNVARAGFQRRVRVERVDAKALPYEDGAFGTTISNSIVHHIPEPRAVLAEMWRVTAPGGLLFVRDLVRPEGPAEIERLVALYGGSHPPARELFRASLHAGLTIPEVEEILGNIGAASAVVRMTSDRHWTLSCVRRA